MTQVKLAFRSLGIIALSVALSCAHSIATAQSAAAEPAPPSGLIFGHVLMADSGAPARFTSVLLKPLIPPDSQNDFLAVLLESALQNMQAKSAGGNSAFPDGSSLTSVRSPITHLLGDVSDSLVAVTVDAEGNYSFTGVSPGEYYVHVRAPGYVDPLAAFTADDLASPDPAERKKIAATTTIVTVGGGQSARADLTLERGATISGRIRYDDGSPAAGWVVRAIAPAASPNPLAGFLGFDLTPLDPALKFQSSTTDDTGLFRIAGLPSGVFVIEARLSTAALDHSPFDQVSSSAGSILSVIGGMSSMASMKLTVYSGDVYRLFAAKSIRVRAGEDHSGTDILVRLHSSHSVAGYVVSKLDGHTINSGSVELISQDDQGNNDISFRRIATIHPDGYFRFDYVPASAFYTIRSTQVADTSTVSTMQILGSVVAGHKSNLAYAPTSTTVDVEDHDITGVRIEVPPSAAN